MAAAVVDTWVSFVTPDTILSLVEAIEQHIRATACSKINWREIREVSALSPAQKQALWRYVAYGKSVEVRSASVLEEPDSDESDVEGLGATAPISTFATLHARVKREEVADSGTKRPRSTGQEQAAPAIPFLPHHPFPQPQLPLLPPQHGPNHYVAHPVIKSLPEPSPASFGPPPQRPSAHVERPAGFEAFAAANGPQIQRPAEAGANGGKSKRPRHASEEDAHGKQPPSGAADAPRAEPQRAASASHGGQAPCALHRSTILAPYPGTPALTVASRSHSAPPSARSDGGPVPAPLYVRNG